jgi:hypothetical protein
MKRGGAGYIQGGRVPRDASVGSSRQQGPSVPSSESSERVNEVKVGAVTMVHEQPRLYDRGHVGSHGHSIHRQDPSAKVDEPTYLAFTETERTST